MLSRKIGNQGANYSAPTPKVVYTLSLVSEQPGKDVCKIDRVAPILNQSGIKSPTPVTRLPLLHVERAQRPLSNCLFSYGQANFKPKIDCAARSNNHITC
jgi:hypothetical protein